MFPPPKILASEIFTRIPDHYNRSKFSSDWVSKRGVGPLPWFLEGPAFDRFGNLFCVDLAHGRIFKIDRQKTWHVFADYDGEPNGLKINNEGYIFVADHRLGLLRFDPNSGEKDLVSNGIEFGGFNGLNDLAFDSGGNLYLTDQGSSGLEDPHGRVFRLRKTGELDLLLDGLPLPNGLVLDVNEKNLYVSLTRSNQIISVPLSTDFDLIKRSRMFIQMSGSPTGPDGMAVDTKDNLVVVHAGFGTVWVFSQFGEPLYRIKSAAGMRTTNVAYGGEDLRTLFITEAEQGVILSVALPDPGVLLYSHR